MWPHGWLPSPVVAHNEQRPEHSALRKPIDGPDQRGLQALPNLSAPATPPPANSPKAGVPASRVSRQVAAAAVCQCVAEKAGAGGTWWAASGRVSGSGSGSGSAAGSMRKEPSGPQGVPLPARLAAAAACEARASACAAVAACAAAL